MKRKYVNRLPKGAEVTGFNAYVENGEIIVNVELKEKLNPKDGDFLVSSKGGVFIYSDKESEIPSLYCCYCGEHRSHLGIRTTFSDNWTEKNGCRFATPEEKDAFIIRLEKECLEDIRWRAAVFEEFCYVDSHGDVCHRTDDLDDCSNNFYDIGNYFRTEEAAQKAANQIKEIFKNSKAE